MINQKNIAYWWGFWLVILAGIFLMPKFLPLMINSDSYAILLPSKLWHEYGYIGGQLGNGGDFFYPLFYRGGLSILVFMVSFLTGYNDLSKIMEIVVLSSYVVSGFLIYDIVFRYYKSVVVAVMSALFMYLSYSFRSWSGVSMAETTTVLIVLLALDALLVARNNFAFFWLSAVLMGVAMMFRMEMMVLFVGWWFLIGKLFDRDVRFKFLYIVVALLCWSGYEFLLYGLMADPNLWVADQVVRWKQTLNFHQSFWMLGLLVMISGLLSRYNKWLLAVPTVAAGVILWKLNMDWYNVLKPLLEFVKYDLFLVIIALVSLGWMLVNKFKTGTVYIWWILMLFLVYFSRQEYRYYVHLVSFLVLAGSYLLFVLLHNKRRWARLLTWFFLAGVGIWQYYLFWNYKFLPDYGYEQMVVANTKQIVENIDKKDLVICSKFSEAVFYETGVASIDCFDGMIDLERVNEKNVLIVADEDMNRHQPDFVNYLLLGVEFEEISEKWVVWPYVEKNEYSVPRYPVKWYLKSAGVKQDSIS